MEPFPLVVRAIAIGIGATVVMDGWLLALRRAGLPILDFAMLGRWAGHLAHGRFLHADIRRAAPVGGERALGWLVHYAVGIGWAAALVFVQGAAWLQGPTLLPALAWGVATVVAPLFVLQPAMGAGVASSRTATPLKNVLRSLANHTVFGLGLFLGAVALARLTA